MQVQMDEGLGHESVRLSRNLARDADRGEREMIG
jgi:hypothetical protein